MKRIAIALSGLFLVTTACGVAGLPPVSGGTSAISPDPSVQRTVAIYSAVIRQLVSNAASGRIVPVYVIDGAVDGAEDPMKPLNELWPVVAFDSAVKEGLIRALPDIKSLTFVAERSQVVVGQGPGHVIGRGVLLTVGPIHQDGASVTVGSSYWMNGLNGQWQTYVVQERGTGWAVTGTTGPSAIS